MPVRRKSESRRRGAKSKKNRLRLLFTCVGRRIELLEAFRRAARSLKVDMTLYGADINWIAPAMHWIDEPRIIPPVTHRSHISRLLKLVSDEEIDLIIPLIDSDLLALSQAVDRFAALGCTLLISDEAVIRTCSDKLLTFEALNRAGVDTPRTWTPKEVLARRRHRFPYFLKPRYGSAGQGLFRINDKDELRVFVRRNPECVVQEFVEGDEYTLDVYTGFDGVPRCVVPRKRLEVRTGEVSKGMVVKDPAIFEVGQRVVEVLGHCRGVITVQCMRTARRRIRVIEVNPRFGGGAPLSIHAGADFPRWILADALGRKLKVNYWAYRDRMTMLRYDESVFVNGKQLASQTAGRGAWPTSHRT